MPIAPESVLQRAVRYVEPVIVAAGTRRSDLRIATLLRRLRRYLEELALLLDGVNDDIWVADVEEWAGGLDENGDLIGPRLSGPNHGGMLWGMRGLLSDEERKNSWTLSECAGHGTPDGMQRLLSRLSVPGCVSGWWGGARRAGRAVA